MSAEETVNRTIIDRESLPEMFPTHRHDPEFWEHLGRAIASIGFLEEVKVLDKPWLDLTSPMGKGILAFMSALAEDERERIARRANEGREAAKSRGVKFGPKPKLTKHRQELALERLSRGDSCRSIAKDMGVAHTTISRLQN
ncbi:MAG: recombinase family protein [Paracoccaceae bacterium]